MSDMKMPRDVTHLAFNLVRMIEDVEQRRSFLQALTNPDVVGIRDLFIQYFTDQMAIAALNSNLSAEELEFVRIQMQTLVTFLLGLRVEADAFTAGDHELLRVKNKETE